MFGIKFGKKKDPLDPALNSVLDDKGLDEQLPAQDMGNFTPPPSDFSQPQNQDAFTPSSFSEKSEHDSKKEYELISSKLDTIKAMLESINQRLDKIENQRTDREQPKKWI